MATRPGRGREESPFCSLLPPPPSIADTDDCAHRECLRIAEVIAMHSVVTSATGFMVMDMVSMLVTFVGRCGKFESEGRYCCASSARISASVRIVGSELVRESLLIFEMVTLDVAVAVVDRPSPGIGWTCSFRRSERMVFQFHPSNSRGNISARTRRLSVCLHRLPRRVEREHLC